MATHLQEEILMDILNRLLVRSLLRFKCVSKFWKTLISDPYFIKKHLNHAKHDKNLHKLLISELYPNYTQTPMYCCPLSSVQLVEDVQKLDYPTNFIPWCCTLKCSCDGLVVIHILGKRNIFDILVSWNPSTRESILLPYPEFPPVNCVSHMGFGYDSTSGDYKILKIDSFVDGPKASGQILALKGGPWRNIDKHPLAVRNLLSGTFSLAVVHEAFHWIIAIGEFTQDKKEHFLVSFSISTEVYGEIPLPEQVLLHSTRVNISYGVEVLEGMLCFYSSLPLPMKEEFTLWVMKDYGVKESWNVLFTIVDPSICLFLPRYRFADGEVLFWCTRHVPSHELVSSVAQKFVFRTSNGPFVLLPRTDSYCSHYGIAFTESLISPKSLI